MQLTSNRRWLAAGAITVAIALAPASPGYADHQLTTGLDRVRERAVTGPDLAPIKTATATCPAGSAVLGAGGQIVAGGGGVTLSAVVPDPTLTSVTARGEALPGHDLAWSVVAVAVCGRAPTFRGLVRSAPDSDTASCPSHARYLTGTGFELPGKSGAQLTGLVPTGSQVTVQARAAGPLLAAPAAYAICAAAGVDQRAVTSPTDPSSPKTVVVPASRVTGVGGQVTGPATDVFIDALLPGPDLEAALVRGTRLAAGGARAAVTGGTGDRWSLTGYAVETADYY